MSNKKKVIIRLCVLFFLIIVILTIIFVVRHNNAQREIAEREWAEHVREARLYLWLIGSDFGLLIDNPDYELFSEGTFERQQVVINLAGLRAIGFSQEEVFEVWMDEENSRREEIRKFFEHWYQIRGALTAIMVRNDLTNVLIENRDSLSAKFPDLDTSISYIPGLPLPVLEEVIRIWEAENIGSSNE